MSDSKSAQKIEVNKKMIGQTVQVIDSDGNWTGIVEGVKDAETLLIRNDSLLAEVDIFNIRSC